MLNAITAMIDDNSNPVQQTSTKGLIHVTSERKKNGRANHADRNVRVTNKKAAQAYQDYSLPAADSNCFAPDVSTARQVLQDRVNQTKLDFLPNIDYQASFNSLDANTLNTSKRQNAGVNGQLNREQMGNSVTSNNTFTSNNTLTSNNPRLSTADDMNQTFKAPLAALVNGGNHSSSLTGKSSRRKTALKASSKVSDKTEANSILNIIRNNTETDEIIRKTESGEIEANIGLGENANSSNRARFNATAGAGSISQITNATSNRVIADMSSVANAADISNVAANTADMSSVATHTTEMLQGHTDNCNHTVSLNNTARVNNNTCLNNSTRLNDNTSLHNSAILDEDGYIEPFAEFESTHNAIYMPQKCSTIHKMTDDEVKEEEAKTLAYERAVHRAALRTEMDEATLRNNPMLMSLLSTSDAARKIMPSGHHPSIHPKKDLIENVKHGTSIFPFACYVWVPQNYSYRVALHWHPEVELVRFNRGLFKISIDMQDSVIEDNAFMLLPGNIMHTFTMPPNCEESALVFDPRMLMLQHYDEVQSEILEVLTTGNMPLPPVITPEHPCFAKIDNLYSYCIEHGATTNASHRLMIKAKLLEILATYHEYGLISRKEVHTNIKRSKQDKLKELLNYIDSHYAGPITIKDASNRLGVTDQYFCRFFKRVTGMSFTEYLNDLRLRRAAKEIELTNRAISDIAYEHGFENVGYFFKSFKNKFSMTPLKYRKKHLADQQK